MAKGKKPTPQEIYWERKKKDEREKAALLPAGLVNHGNTCFMNSVLQGLVATHLLEDLVLFRSPESLPLASRRSPLLTNGRGPEDIQKDWVQGMTLGDVFVQIIERSWRVRDARERTSMNPKELLARLGAKYDQYLDFRQQDAHEFLLHLLDGMRMEEFDIIKQRQPPPPRKPKSRSHGEKDAKNAPPNSIPDEERLTSFVDMTFGGKLASVLICETCKHVSHTYEDFDDLSLSITHDESKERMRDRLRTFASKFKSSSQRSRDQTSQRPMSFSQPPSPPLPPTTLDVPEDVEEVPRRRSLEASTSLPSTPRNPKIDLLEGYAGSQAGGGIGEFPTPQPKSRSHKISGEAALGKLGRRISVGMALASKKDKKPGKTETESKTNIVEEEYGSAKNNGIDSEKSVISWPTSRPSSRPRSPTPKAAWKEKGKRRKLSEHEALKAVYLRRLLEDPPNTLSSPLMMLRAATPLGPGSNPQWSRVGSVQNIEDCLKMFTTVEVLDGENMFGCRNCWKINNGEHRARRNTQSSDDSQSSDDDNTRQQDYEPQRPDLVDPIHSFSMPNLPQKGDSMRSFPHTNSIPPPLASLGNSIEAAGSITMDSTQERPSPYIPSTSTMRYSQPNTTHPRSLSTLQKNEDTVYPRSFGSEPALHGFPIPTINAISPPADSPSFDFPSASAGHIGITTERPNIPHAVHFQGQLGAYATSSRDSLRLPAARTHRRRDTPREGDGSLSSEDSEYDDTSGVSDGDGSVVSESNSVESRRPSKSEVPRSKQVVYRRALKRYLIARPPPVLVIHLKRFQQVSKSPVTLFGNLKKLDEYVSFPEYLDIRPFLAPKKEDYGLARGELKGKVTEKGKRLEDQPCVYRLYTVVVHIGNMLGGHYIAYTALPAASDPPVEPHGEFNALSNGRLSVEPLPGKVEVGGSAIKNERQWCYISDTVVRLASLDEVLKSKAYICMYERLP